LVALLFPGQGSQEVGMGAPLFAHFEDLIEQANRVLGYSIVELCLRDPMQQLGMTQFTQPALFVVSALSYLHYLRQNTHLPTYVIGHSVGEYAALFAAGAFDFITGLQLVKKRGELMSRASNGGMSVIIGLTEKQIRLLFEEHQLSTLDIANHNSSTQIVLAGPRDDLLAAQPLFEEAGAKMYKPLNVSGAFHSRYMRPIQEEFSHYVQGFHFAELRIPVISTVHAQLYTHHDLPPKLIEQLTQPVRWTQSIEHLFDQGECTYIEVGPGQVLTKLVRRIRREIGLQVVEQL
jgi:trans-AT polyketide synthase/acyltransferase/oxidoreductase domain-containing protein